MTDKLDIEFKNVVNYINNNTSNKINNETLLFFYSHYKQATIGDCNISKPNFLDIKGNYKYDAWNKLKGMNKNIAKKIYIDKFKELKN
jgi:diazepam-binding inhibitor (GABA receptor modulating acyl-CoA-binding protein)